jgi:transcriptional regulator with XRE-family HTH domain
MADGITLADRLKALRKAAGFETQKALADYADVKQTVIADIETGRSLKPRADTARRIAAALGSTPEALFGDAPTAPERDEAGDVDAVRVSADQVPMLNAAGLGEGGALVLARVTTDALECFHIVMGDILAIEIGGVLIDNMLVALTPTPVDPAFDAFIIRRRVPTGASASPVFRPTGRIYMLSSRAPFNTIVDPKQGRFRTAGPVVGLFRNDPNSSIGRALQRRHQRP